MSEVQPKSEKQEDAYGADSRLTEDDKKDLKELYSLVWSGKLREINGTAIRLVTPFHNLRELSANIALK